MFTREYGESSHGRTSQVSDGWWILTICPDDMICVTSSTAQGGGGSLKNRIRIGEVGWDIDGSTLNRIYRDLDSDVGTMNMISGWIVMFFFYL